jgi:hypothetical protein
MARMKRAIRRRGIAFREGRAMPPTWRRIGGSIAYLDGWLAGGDRRFVGEIRDGKRGLGERDGRPG